MGAMSAAWRECQDGGLGARDSSDGRRNSDRMMPGALLLMPLTHGSWVIQATGSTEWG
jgi:hypothetical protein